MCHKYICDKERAAKVDRERCMRPIAMLDDQMALVSDSNGVIQCIQNTFFGHLFLAADYSSSDYVKEEPIKMNIRGIRRTFYPPAQQTQIDNAPPDKKLQLKWVHGYRGRDTHKNLWVLPSGELLYYVAAVAILYDRDEETQRHYTGHTEDIMRLLNRLFTIFLAFNPLFRFVSTLSCLARSMDIHPSRELVASGQLAGTDRKSQAHVRIWSSDSLQTLYVFGMGELMGGVTAVAFSQLVRPHSLIAF